MKALKVILTSVDTKKAAENLAQGLLTTKLAACIQISAAGLSFYLWHGDVCREEEFYLQIKTNKTHLKAVIAWLKANHPYDTPEIICLDAKTSRDYHNWLTSSLK